LARKIFESMLIICYAKVYLQWRPAMPNPQMPNVPGAVTDTLDFVKNLWGSMGVPGMGVPGLGAPTLSVDDLDKKIADLKAVESWLNVNVSMLRGTIQALEIQRGTLATLKSMGASLADAMKQPGADQKSVLAGSPFASFFGQPAAAAPQAPKPPAQPAQGAQAAPAAASPFVPDATLWWNVLQDQFKQAVSGAMSSDAMTNAGAMAQDAAAKMTAAVTPKPAADDKSAGSPAGSPAGSADEAPESTKPKASKPKPPAR
jgi:hypothetical protein